MTVYASRAGLLLIAMLAVSTGATQPFPAPIEKHGAGGADADEPRTQDAIAAEIQREYETRYGATAGKFSEVPSSIEKPVEVCGIPRELEFLTRVRCDNGSNPFPARGAAFLSRRGSVGRRGQCPSILDLYTVPCPEKTYEVYIDPYVCPVRAGALGDMDVGDALRKRCDFESAIRYYTRAIESGDLPHKDLLRTFNRRGDAYGDTGQYERAISDYDTVIRLDQDDPFSLEGEFARMSRCELKERLGR